MNSPFETIHNTLKSTCETLGLPPVALLTTTTGKAIEWTKGESVGSFGFFETSHKEKLCWFIKSPMGLNLRCGLVSRRNAVSVALVLLRMDLALEEEMNMLSVPCNDPCPWLHECRGGTPAIKTLAPQQERDKFLFIANQTNSVAQKYAETIGWQELELTIAAPEIRPPMFELKSTGFPLYTIQFQATGADCNGFWWEVIGYEGEILRRGRCAASRVARVAKHLLRKIAEKRAG